MQSDTDIDLNDPLEDEFLKDLYSKNFDLYNIYISNIPEKVRDIEKLTNLFSVFGKIVKINIRPDARSAIVQYEQSESARRALLSFNLHSIYIEESWIQPPKPDIPNSNNDFILDHLNVDCLYYLYSYLKFQDQLNLEKISFHQKSMLQYYYKINKTFDLKNVEHTTLYAIKNFLMENGESIENLVLLGADMPYSDYYYESIYKFALKYCPNIVKMKKTILNFKASSINLCQKGFPNLKYLYLHCYSDCCIFDEDVCEVDFKEFFKFENLETLIIKGYQGDNFIVENNLNSLYPNLKHLKIDKTDLALYERDLNVFAKHFSNLETLQLSLENFSSKKFDPEIAYLRMLKQLGIHFKGSDCARDCLNFLKALTDSHLVSTLEILKISSSMTAEHYTLIKRFGNLKKLKVDYVNENSQRKEFFTMLSRFSKTNLEYLTISGLYSVDDNYKIIDDFIFQMLNFLQKNMFQKVLNLKFTNKCSKHMFTIKNSKIVKRSFKKK